jgi:hypothetical protein
MQAIRARATLALGATLSTLVLAGCGAIGFGSERPVAPLPALAGAWAGSWVVEGQRIDGTLTLRQDGSDLSATFTSRGLGGDATGSGKVDAQGQVHLQLKYRTTCGGSAQLTGALDGGGRLGGSLSASDCTGKAAGTFSFTRR